MAEMIFNGTPAQCAAMHEAYESCCIVSPSNPRAVAEAIPEMMNVLLVLVQGAHQPDHVKLSCFTDALGRASILLSRLGIEERKG